MKKEELEVLFASLLVQAEMVERISIDVSVLGTQPDLPETGKLYCTVNGGKIYLHGSATILHNLFGEKLLHIKCCFGDLFASLGVKPEDVHVERTNHEGW